MPPKPSKVISRADVKALSNEKKCLVVIQNKVYDVTDFLDEHPGGRETIMDVNGMDGTSEFDAVGHSKSAVEQMAKYLVGEVPEGERDQVGKKAGGAGGSLAPLILVLLLIGGLIAYMMAQK
eukprot:PhF_6_TR9495/c0_g1_i1/m.14808